MRVSVIGAGILVAIFSPNGAAASDFRPAWSKQPGVLSVLKNPNSSVLYDPHYREIEEGNGWAESVRRSSIQTSALQEQVREEWAQIQTRLEVRERHHLVGQNEQLEASNRYWQLGRTYLRSLFSTQIRDSLKKAEKNSDSVRAVVQAQQKIDFMANQGLKVEMVSTSLGFASRCCSATWKTLDGLTLDQRGAGFSVWFR